ncbi:hypothetical protein ES702_05188 [subsurface metagenome]
MAAKVPWPANLIRRQELVPSQDLGGCLTLHISDLKENSPTAHRRLMELHMQPSSFQNVFCYRKEDLGTSTFLYAFRLDRL